MSDGDPREALLRAVAAELRVGPLTRRRILIELAHHIDDAVDELSGSGVPREQAIAQAIRRLGDAETISSAFGAMRTQKVSSGPRVRHSLAWVAVGAMSVVTAWAAELPQASGAKPPAKHAAPAPARLTPTEHATGRYSVGRTRIAARPRHDGHR